MSAFLCGQGTLSLVVDIVKSEEFKNNYDTENFSEKEPCELMNILSDLNTKSLDARYGKSQDNILENKEYIHFDVDECQKHKSVCCYLYQTCESVESSTHPLFQSLEKWSNDSESRYDVGYWWEHKWNIDGECRQ